VTMPLEVAIAFARNRWYGSAWVAEERSVGADGLVRTWCTVGTQTDEYSRQTIGAGPTFEAAFANADVRLAQRRGPR
jgi:hypothetical protein